MVAGVVAGGAAVGGALVGGAVVGAVVGAKRGTAGEATPTPVAGGVPLVKRAKHLEGERPAAREAVARGVCRWKAPV